MGGHQAEAEDALSLVMMKARENLAASAGKIINLEAWLHRLAKNLCIDVRREQLRRARTAESWKLTTLVEAKPDQPLWPLERESEIQQQIAALPFPLRQPFVLHVIREIPVKAVAVQLGLTPLNVRKRLQLARARLRRDLARREAGNPDPASAPGKPPLADPARPPRRQPGPPELSAPAVVLRTVRVKLPCGVEQLFHVFADRVPVLPERTKKVWRQYVREHPGGWKKRLELAGLLHLTGDWAGAVEEWQRLLAVRPHLPAAVKLGETLLKLGDPVAAAKVFKHIRRQPLPSVATGRHLDGWIAFCQPNAGRSVMEFQAATELEPTNPAHWHGLALAHGRAGALPEALAAIRQSLTLNPNDLVALSLGHELWLAAGDVEEAMRCAQQLLSLFPLDLLTMRRLAGCRLQRQQNQGASVSETKTLLRRALRLSQNSFLFREPLAAFFLCQGKPQKALTVHREFAEQHPHCPRGRRDYAQMLTATGLPQSLSAPPPRWPGPLANQCNGACNWGARADGT
jgi:RNA polymerase sigma factor (sigma-70 family)